MRNKIYFSALFALVFGLWFFYPSIISSQVFADFLPKSDWTKLGLFGDSFGALNTLFSGLALAGLAINIYLQNIQLKKLDQQEQENSKRIDAQVETQSLTALLNYYNSEVDRLTLILTSVHKDMEPALKDTLRDTHLKLTSEREILLKLFRSKVSLPD